MGTCQILVNSGTIWVQFLKTKQKMPEMCKALDANLAPISCMGNITYAWPTVPDSCCVKGPGTKTADQCFPCSWLG